MGKMSPQQYQRWLLDMRRGPRLQIGAFILTDDEERVWRSLWNAHGDLLLMLRDQMVVMLTDRMRTIEPVQEVISLREQCAGINEFLAHLQAAGEGKTSDAGSAD